MKYYGKVKEKIVKETREVEYIRCDKCSKKINKKYYRITTGHGDWGNDSCDSIRHFDICDNCIQGFFEKYLKEYENSNTAYFECESECFRRNSDDYGPYDYFEDALVEEDDLE